MKKILPAILVSLMLSCGTPAEAIMICSTTQEIAR